MAWRRQRQLEPDREALSIAHLSQALELKPPPLAVDESGLLSGRIRIVPAGFPQTDERVWLVLTAVPRHRGEVRVELGTALAEDGAPRPLAEVACHWPPDPTSVAPTSWSLAGLEPELAAAHERRGGGDAGELLEIVRDRLEHIRAEELAERPDLASLTTTIGPTGRPSGPEEIAADLEPGLGPGLERG